VLSLLSAPERPNCRGGSSICEHNHQRSRCKICGGSSVCENNPRRSFFKTCGGSAVRHHMRIKYAAKSVLLSPEAHPDVKNRGQGRSMQTWALRQNMPSEEETQIREEVGGECGCSSLIMSDAIPPPPIIAHHEHLIAPYM
jgi:hypothetical protein